MDIARHVSEGNNVTLDNSTDDGTQILVKVQTNTTLRNVLPKSVSIAAGNINSQIEEIKKLSMELGSLKNKKEDTITIF